MKFVSTLMAAAAVLGSAQAQSNGSLCDKYTTALLKENNGTNQLTLLTLLVNTAIIGNYTTNPGSMVKVDGILTPGTYNGTAVDLRGFFNGSLASSNENGKATAVNYLDGGGAAPLKNNTAGAPGSRQYTLVTHLYQYFGYLLGCNATGFPAYEGDVSQSEVHRFMNINPAQNGYFIQQVGNAALSFGVSMEDATTVGNNLNMAFNYRCSPPAAIPSNATAASQSICLASSCPQAPNGNCQASGTSYPNGTNGAAPAAAAASPSSSGSGSGSNGASGMVVNALGALAVGAAGLVAVGL